MTENVSFKSSRPNPRPRAPRSLVNLSFFVVCLLFSLVPSALSSSSGCAGVRVAYGALGLVSTDVPAAPIPGEELRVCASPHTCCTRDVETRLSERARADLTAAMSGALSHLYQTYSYTSDFDSFFNQLLVAAEYDLNKMFVTTYGLLYQQNSHVFTDLFADLRSYYRGGKINLTDVLDSFFATLLQKMFQLLNAQYYLDQYYLACVSDTMDELQPFGDVPERLSLDLRRSFVAARAFVQGLSVGRNVVHRMSELKPSAECQDAVMRSLYCAYCQGLPFLKPCNRLCLDVMRLCLRGHMEIDDAWDQYIDHMLQLGDRLEGPYNIEQVVDPIDVQISDAIMNFQENSAVVSKRVFKVCGTPRHHHRRKRRGAPVDAEEDEEEEEARKDTKTKPLLEVADEEGISLSTARNETSKTAADRARLVVMDDVNGRDSIVFIDDDDDDDDDNGNKDGGTELTVKIGRNSNVDASDGGGGGKNAEVMNERGGGGRAGSVADRNRGEKGGDDDGGDGKKKSRSKRKGIVEGTTEMDYLHPKNRNKNKKKKKNNGNNNRNKSGGKRRKPLISKPGGGAGSLANLVRNIKNKVKVGRGFWSHFPYALCNDEILSAPADIGDNCWNGKGRGRYERGGGGKDGASEEKIKAFYSRLSEFSSSRMHSARRRGGGGRKSFENWAPVDVEDAVAEQLVALRDISAKLKRAYDGLEVDWLADVVVNDGPENGPRFEARRAGGGGSGDGDVEYSSSGDGAGVDDEDYGDDGDEDADWSGSGDGVGWETVDSAASGGGDISFDPLNPLKPDISPLPGNEKRERAGVGQSTGGGGGAGWSLSGPRWMTLTLLVAVVRHVQ